jgi:protein-L-isoaspartate(D-aspartate) O-methyltransferase
VSDDRRKADLIASLSLNGIRDERVLSAIADTPRELFLNEAFKHQAYADSALPIACGQTISQPYVVAFMTEALKLEPHHRVLEIGTGSGYQTAILAHLAKMIYTVERYRTLSHEAGERLKRLKLANVMKTVADGRMGWPQQAPFDRIIVTAAAKDIPEALLDQLAPGGILVLPLEKAPGKQELYRIVNTETEFASEPLLPVRFVPLVEGVAKES